jgi:hypothetical protein
VGWHFDYPMEIKDAGFDGIAVWNLSTMYRIKSMDNQQEFRAIGVLSNRMDTEDALFAIKSIGFPMDKLSVVGRNAGKDDRVAGVEIQDSIDDKADQGAVAGAATGAAISRLGY